MLRNFNQPELCNGTRLVIKKADGQFDSRVYTQREIQRLGSSNSEDYHDTNQYALWV